MSMKSRLFASVAAPVLSLPLLMQPAYALPSAMDIGLAQPAAPAIIRVQEQVPAEGEEIPKRRKPQADQGEGAERPRGERQQRAEQPDGERPQRRQQQADQGEGGEKPQRRQQQDAGQAEERPQPRQREQRAEQPDAERPQRRQQNAEQAPEPRQQATPDAAQAEQPKPRKERQEKAEQPKSEQPAAEPSQRQQAGQGDAIQPPKPRAQQNADQAPEPKQPDTQQAEQPKPRPERQQQAVQPQAEQPQGRPQQAEQPQAERPQQAEQPQAERPQRQQAGQGDVIQPPKPRPQQNADQAPVAPQPDKKAGEPPRPPRQQAQDAGKAPERAVSGGERNQPRPVEQSAEQPRLPVENGAAVLDSAKEQRPDRAQRDGSQRDGERPRRDGNRPGDPRAPDQQQAQDRPMVPPPRTDADAQANDRVTREERDRWRNQRRELVEERGERLDRRPDFEQPRGWDVRGPVDVVGDRDPRHDRDRDDGRVIISIDNQTVVRHNDSRRFYEDGRPPEYERLGDGRYREVVERSDGTRVVTIRNRYGEVVQRSRIVRGGREYVLYYAPELLEDRRDYTWRDPGDDLPPMRLGVPVDDYIIDTSSEPDRDYYQFLEQPPVERVERPYSLDEVRYSARIRDKVPRIDLDTITFATGSAEIPMNQASSLRKVADAINQVLQKDPSETFLIEGHTDAVGTDDSNLVLSDRRAESVAVVLSDAFGIPPENLTTQGYGEQYLKVNTQAANQENRRVTIRRITPLVKPVASNQ